MREVVSGGKRIDRCMTCGGLWFDPGEIGELAAGRLAAAAEPGGKEAQAGIAAGGGPSGPNGVAPPHGVERSGEGKPPAAAASPRGERGPSGKQAARMWRAAARLACPRCFGRLHPVDFQATGIFLFSCRSCGGLLASRGAAAEIEARFDNLRRHQAEYAALAEAIAEAERRRFEARLGASPFGGRRVAGGRVPLPVVVPLSDAAPARRGFPVAAWGIVAIVALLYVFRSLIGAPPRLPGGLAGLRPGAGFSGLPVLAFLCAPFVHAGLFPLLGGCLFLSILGDNVEDRIGTVAYLVFFFLCAAAGSAVHLLWGEPAGRAAMGSAVAAAGILGAYVVFFPDVPIRMYGMGRVAAIPAYLFACVWLAWALLFSGGRLALVIDPAPYSFAAQLAGFGSGALCAIGWRLAEEAS